MSSAKRASAKGKGKRASTTKKGAGAKSPKKGGAKAKGKANKTEEKKVNNTPIELPNSADFTTVLPPMKVFPTMYETDINDLKATFDDLLDLLQERREAVLKDAQVKVDKCKFDSVNSNPIRIDTATINGRINRCGTDLGPKWYEYERSKNAVSDCLLELIACEEKLQYVGGDFTKTKSVKGIKNAIGKVEAELKKTEPVLQAAKDAVKNITKASLDEIRALPKPHNLLVKAVQACALLIGTPEKDVKDWSSIRKMLKTAFVNNLIAFEGADVKAKTVKRIERDFLGRGNDDMKSEDKLTFENVKKANAVAGNLVKWLEAQLKYNEMLPLVTAKRAELKDLQLQLAMMDGSSVDLGNAIKTLGKRVEDGKGKFISLIKKYEKQTTVYEQAVADCE